MRDKLAGVCVIVVLIAICHHWFGTPESPPAEVLRSALKGEELFPKREALMEEMAKREEQVWIVPLKK